MDDLAIAAIIPLYNGAEFIEQALRSVLAQTLRPARIIVVDDGSTDSGPDIVAGMARDHGITVITKQNGGQSSARNLGVSHVGTPLIAFLDQDDIWYPHHLAELIGPFRQTRYPELGWVYSNLDEIDREGRMVTRDCLDMLPKIEHPKRSLRGCLATDMFTVPSSTLVLRTAFQAAGGFDEDLIGYEDDDLFLRMFRLGYDNVYIKKASAKWRIFSGSTSHSPRMRQSRMVYLRKLMAIFPPGEKPGDIYWRELLAPRFFPWLLQEYLRVQRTGDSSTLRAAVDDLRLLVPFLAHRSRLVMQLAMPLMVNQPLARLGANMTEWNLPLAKRMLRRVLR